MEVQILSSAQHRMNFEQQLISDYLRLESIEAVFKERKYNLPISFAGFARLLSKNKVVTTAGPNSHLSETLFLLSILKDCGGSLSQLSKKINLTISTKTLHRILHAVRMGVTRRFGAALLLEDSRYPGKFLLGKDASLRKKFGEKGDWSLPMSHTREQDSHYASILRVLQREVFAEQTAYGEFPFDILNQSLSPVFSIDIADIKVYVYYLKYDFSNLKFSSFKLSEHEFFDVFELENMKMRSGVLEIVTNFGKVTDKHYLNSDLNLALKRPI